MPCRSIRAGHGSVNGVEKADASRLQLQEVFDDLRSYGTALLGMKLGAEEVVAAERSAEGVDVVARGDGVGTQLGIVGVHVVDIGSVGDVAEEGSAEVGNLVPAHVGDFEC